MKQYILTDTTTGQRLHSDMQILTSQTALILKSRLEVNGIAATIGIWNNDNDFELCEQEEGFLWSNRE